MLATSLVAACGNGGSGDAADGGTPTATLAGTIDDAQGERYQFTLDRYDASYAQALPADAFDGLRSEGWAIIIGGGGIADSISPTRTASAARCSAAAPSTAS